MKIKKWEIVLASLTLVFLLFAVASDTAEKNLIFTNKYNPGGTKLPETGGSGMTPFAIAGTITVLGAAGAFFYRRKIKAVLANRK